MKPGTVSWRVHLNSFRYASEDAAALTVAVRGLYAGAPEIRPEHTSRLLGGKREVTVNGEDGSRLMLTRGPSTNRGGIYHEIRIDFQPGDYGLAEFDRIMLSLLHSAPVAAAARAIHKEEQKQQLWAALNPKRLRLPRFDPRRRGV